MAKVMFPSLYVCLFLPPPNGDGYVFISVRLLLAKIVNFGKDLVCPFVCLSVCLFVFDAIQAAPFE